MAGERESRLCWTVLAETRTGRLCSRAVVRCWCLEGAAGLCGGPSFLRPHSHQLLLEPGDKNLRLLIVVFAPSVEMAAAFTRLTGAGPAAVVLFF